MIDKGSKGKTMNMKGRMSRTRRFVRALLALEAAAALFAVSPLFAGGKQEEARTPVNETWTLCIADFDAESLPQARAILKDSVMRNIADSFRTANKRLWTSEEGVYYNTAVRLKAQSAAAKQLAAKQLERDRLIFAGESEYRYKQNLKKLDKEIAILWNDFEKAEAEPAPIAISPSVRLAESNLTGTYPEAPVAGHEYYFCTAQKADALLSGRLSEYFDRIYVEISLWSVYAQKTTYTDSIIFSPDGIKEASEEIALRLSNHISGYLPAWLTVKANPRNAVIIVDEFVAGEGESGLLNFTPGTVGVTAFAENHETFTATVDLMEGEVADVTLDLRPYETAEFDVQLEEEGAAPASVYDGAQYIGETPLRMKGNVGQKKNLNILTADGYVANTVFEVSGDTVSLEPRPAPAENRTNVARRKFYSAYGRFWLTLPLAVLGWGLNGTMNTALEATGSLNPDLAQQQQIVQWTAIGATALMGAFLAESFVRIGLYVREANRESSPLIRAKVEDTSTDTSAEDTDAALDDEDSGLDTSVDPADLIQPTGADG